MSAFGELFKKASDAINNFRGGNNFFLGKDGDIVFSKNNVCVHETGLGTQDEGEIQHTPGYLTIYCQNDETIGVSLVLQWLPNTTLHKNPGSIRSVSPRNHNGEPPPRPDLPKTESDELSGSSDMCTTEDDTSVATSGTSPDIQVEMNGDVMVVTSVQDRPKTLLTPYQNSLPVASLSTTASDGLGVPTINLIPNTPIDHPVNGMQESNLTTVDSCSQSSLSTSGADEFSEAEEELHSSSCDDSDNETGDKTNAIMNGIRDSFVLFDTTPEKFALEHHLMLTETKNKAENVALVRGRVMYSNKANSASLFSVNLGKMRSMRLFYSNQEYTSGQLVIASPDSHYKILHFHHGGLDKLAQLFEQWSAIKAKSVKDGSPSPYGDRHLLICQPAVSKSELDPEDGLYEKVTWDLWKSYKNTEGAVDDSISIRKTIFFASMEPSVRKDIWPFLLRVYPWQSTVEQRETIRNDIFLEYQNLRKKRTKKFSGPQRHQLEIIENTIEKDVVRTDRKNPYYAGENNPNMEIMKNILLNYAIAYPEVNYIQGMSDLLAPILSTIRDESDAYWCFCGLMRHTVFSSNPKGNENLMEQNLDYLRELLKFLEPDFYNYLASLKGDALQLMFVHRWILLSFKREFPDSDAMHIWEACWARYRTNHFHLFVCVAIVSIYGKDVISQRLPHDEILLYFSSLAMHMDARVVLKKARGLLYEFCRRERIPCTLAGFCAVELEQWDTHRPTQLFECSKIHGNYEPCPFAN